MDNKTIIKEVQNALLKQLGKTQDQKEIYTIINSLVHVEFVKVLKED